MFFRGLGKLMIFSSLSRNDKIIILDYVKEWLKSLENGYVRVVVLFKIGKFINWLCFVGGIRGYIVY